MNIKPEKFLSSLSSGITEIELNLKEDLSISTIELTNLAKKYEHTIESATKYLQTDYSNGYTICRKCGSYYHLGDGFTKHLSDGCLYCEGEHKHRVYHVEKSSAEYGGFPARYMSIMFDDKMSYRKDKLQIEKYKKLILEV